MSISKKRFIYNTHENAERPYYVSALLKKCTKARESISMDNLANIVHRRLRREIGFPIPRRAAPYLIELAVELGILERDIYKQGIIRRWGASGYVISNISPDIPSGPDIPSELPDDLRLLERDRLAYLKYFLDSDGIALIYLLRRLSSAEEIHQSEFLKRDDVEQLWREIIGESLKNIRSDRLRSEVRQVRNRSRFLAGKPRAKGKGLEHVRKHHFTPHIETLVDLDIVERIPPPSNWRPKAIELLNGDKGLKKQAATSSQDRINYRPRLVGSLNRVEKFLEHFGDPSTLDRVLSRSEGTFFRCAADLYGLRYPRANLSDDFDLVEKEVVKSYESVRDDVYRLAFLDAVMDIVCINLQSLYGKVCEPQDVWAAVEEMHKSSESEVRYHRDNYGVIAYIAFSQGYVDKVLSSPAAV